MPRRREIGLDWDEENEAHLARHGAYPDALGEMIAGGAGSGCETRVNAPGAGAGASSGATRVA